MHPTPTLSPTLTLVTLEPTSVTVPQSSCPGTIGKIASSKSLSPSWQSEWQIPEYFKSNFTSNSPHFGLLTHRGLNFSPYLSIPQATSLYSLSAQWGIARYLGNSDNALSLLILSIQLAQAFGKTFSLRYFFLSSLTDEYLMPFNEIYFKSRMLSSQAPAAYT